MQNTISANHYTFVENESSEFYGVKFRNDSPYSGVVVVYGTVSIKESQELDIATLSFTFNIQDAGPRNIDELEASEEFKNYLGDVLGTIISEENNGHIESAADAHTESSPQ